MAPGKRQNLPCDLKKRFDDSITMWPAYEACKGQGGWLLRHYVYNCIDFKEHMVSKYMYARHGAKV